MTGEPGWSPRLGAAGAVFQGRMWLLGGVERYYDGTPAHLRSDVWSSADGKHWKHFSMPARSMGKWSLVLLSNRPRTEGLREWLLAGLRLSL